MLGMPNIVLSAVCLAIQEQIMSVFRIAVLLTCSWNAVKANGFQKQLSMAPKISPPAMSRGSAGPTLQEYSWSQANEPNLVVHQKVLYMTTTGSPAASNC